MKSYTFNIMLTKTLKKKKCKKTELLAQINWKAFANEGGADKCARFVTLAYTATLRILNHPFGQQEITIRTEETKTRIVNVVLENGQFPMPTVP